MSEWMSLYVLHFILPWLLLSISRWLSFRSPPPFLQIRFLFHSACIIYVFRQCDFQPDYIDGISECQQCTHTHTHSHRNDGWWMWVFFIRLFYKCTQQYMYTTCIETERNETKPSNFMYTYFILLVKVHWSY